MKKSEIEKLIERLHKHYADALMRDEYNKHTMPLDCEFAADALKELLADRDAAVNDLRVLHVERDDLLACLRDVTDKNGKCDGCKHIGSWCKEYPCTECMNGDINFWEWRGIDSAALSAVPLPADAEPVAERNEPLPCSDPMPAETRDDILRRAAECVSGQRAQDYGKPENNFALIAKLWSAYRGIEFDAVDVAMMMALLKIARISGGNGTPDCFVDLAGYAACGGEIYAKGGAPIERR